MPRCPDGFHRSPDGDCESITGNKDEEDEDEEDNNDDFSDSSKSKKSNDDDTSFFFPYSGESEDNSNQDTISNENDIDLTNNVETSDFQENSIPSNIIDDIMRKHQQFAYTLGNPHQTYNLPLIQKDIIKNLQMVIFFGIHNLVLMKFIVEYQTNGIILVVKREHLDILLVMNMILMEVVKATLKKVI